MTGRKVMETGIRYCLLGEGTKKGLERNNLKLSPFGSYLCEVWRTLYMENLVSLFAEHHARVTQQLARYKPHQGAFRYQRGVRI